MFTIGVIAAGKSSDAATIGLALLAASPVMLMTHMTPPVKSGGMGQGAGSARVCPDLSSKQQWAMPAGKTANV